MDYFCTSPSCGATNGSTLAALRIRSDSRLWDTRHKNQRTADTPPAPGHTTQIKAEGYSDSSRAKTPPRKTAPSPTRAGPQAVAQSLRPPPRRRLPTDGATSYTRKLRQPSLDQEPLIN
jgi:hypothetical protein